MKRRCANISKRHTHSHLLGGVEQKISCLAGWNSGVCRHQDISLAGIDNNLSLVLVHHMDSEYHKLIVDACLLVYWTLESQTKNRPPNQCGVDGGARAVSQNRCTEDDDSSHVNGAVST